MEIYAANLRIQSEYGKVWTRKISVFGYFLHSVISDWLSFLLISIFIWLQEQPAEDLLFEVEIDEPVTVLLGLYQSYQTYLEFYFLTLRFLWCEVGLMPIFAICRQRQASLILKTVFCKCILIFF